MDTNYNDLNELNHMNNSVRQTFFYENTCKNDKKRIQRDPFAHRRVEKTRRDRMNLSLNKLSSLIPESFRRQSATTRIDKIKTLDLAIAYVEHLQSLVGQVKLEDSERSSKPISTPLVHEKNSPSLSNKSTNTQVFFDENLLYMRGLYNGTKELITYLIESQASQENSNEMCDNIECMLSFFRQFHRIYFNEHQIDDEKHEFIKSCLKSKRFPLNNRKIMQKVGFALANEQLPVNFYKSICKLLQKKSMRIRKSSSSSISSDSDKKDSNSNGNVSSDYDMQSKLTTNNRFQSAESSSVRSAQSESRFSRNSANESIWQGTAFSQTKDCVEKDKVKKLKSNLIRRFNDSSESPNPRPPFSNSSQDNRNNDIIEIKPSKNEMITSSCSNNVLSHSKQTEFSCYQNILDKCNISKLNNETSNAKEIAKNTMLSIFIMHNSHDFYLSACIDESLIEENLLCNILKNKEFKPNALQKIKLDVSFASNIVIQNKKIITEK